ncbi:MAG: AzlD domain-containing protein [Rhodobacteraceae bacterium]|nr:AzlD domain-containing protein [Paracoccaceae bacterium]
MSPDVMILALTVGAANWCFRYLPTRASGMGRMPGGAAGRFLAATGPAAIATLFVASVLPWALPSPRDVAPLAAGLAAVLAVFAATRSVAAATVAGALGCGAVVAALGP